jgi:hypothetical protein
MDTPDLEKKLGELEDELKDRDKRILELRDERDQDRALIGEMTEHVEEANALIERWKDAFDMVPNDDGIWTWQEGVVQERDAYVDKYTALLKEWNKIVPEYNAVVAPKLRNFGRPLDASEAQQHDVLERRKAHQSLRDIADATNLSLRTVRSITDKAAGVDRSTLARLKRIAPDKIIEARQRAGRRLRDALPRQINAALEHGSELIKRGKRGD